MANETHAVGDKVSVSGIVTGVNDNAGRVEYSIAVEEKGEEYGRPLNIPAAVDPLAATDGYAEYQKEMATRSNNRADDEHSALDKEADKTRKETDTPDPRDKAAGNASVDAKDVKPSGAVVSKTSPNK